MNSLSWFIYAIDLLTSMQVVFILLSVLAAGFTLASVIGCAVTTCEINSRHPDEWAAKWLPHWSYIRRRALPALVLCLMVAAALPSKNTMYAIAASQVGEKIAANETVQGVASDASKALQQWIKKQLVEEEKK